MLPSFLAKQARKAGGSVAKSSPKRNDLMMKPAWKALLFGGFLLLCLSLSSCKKQEIPSIFDMVDYMVGVSLDPGRITINGRYYEWFPSKSDIQWAFGLGTAKDFQSLVYEKIGIIARHNTRRVHTLELLYDPSAGQYPCENSFQGTLFINGSKIPSDLKASQLETLFPEFKIIKEKDQVKLYSKTEHLLVLPNTVSEEDKNLLNSFIEERLTNCIIVDRLFPEKERVNQYFRPKDGFYATNKGDNPELEQFLEATLKLDTYKILSKTPIEIIFHFDPLRKNLRHVIINIGVEGKRRIEYF
jgi:hypothetical protein